MSFYVSRYHFSQIFRACVCYFSLFLKDRCISSLTFFFPLFHKDLVSPGLPCATCLLETSCLEKIAVCVIKTMLKTLPLVQMNKAQREVNQTNQVQTKINIMKGLQTSVITNSWEHMPLNIKSNEIF